jgi:hypothetical protein
LKGLFIDPIPFIPFPLVRGRGGILKRGGLSPLLNTHLFSESKREAVPLLKTSSPSLV